MQTTIRQQISEYLPEIIALRHAIHKHPELRYEEVKTAQLVDETLRSYGYTTTTGIAKTGVCAVLDSGKPGKTVALRADMDALPIQEATQLPFASEVPGVMHACGHDGHTATLLLAAKVLMQHRHAFTGKIKFIFQPAEELGYGALKMVDAGILKNPDVDAIFGYHNVPTMPQGKILVKSGCIFGGLITFAITIHGVGGHSSAPEKAVDPIYVGSTVVQALQSIVSRNNSAFEPLVISVTQFHAGQADNVIPDKAILRGSIRFIENKAIAWIKAQMEQVVTHTCAALGANADINFEDEVPATINTPAETMLLQTTAMQLFGEDNVVNLAHNIMATEDFSYYLQNIPGCFFLVGTGENKTYLHHPAYQFEDAILPIAAETLIHASLNYLTASYQGKCAPS
jgi:hippurate hydrolase